MDLIEYEKIVLKYWAGYANAKAIKKIAEVCMHAGYFEQDIAELCDSINEELEVQFRSGVNQN